MLAFVFICLDVSCTAYAKRGTLIFSTKLFKKKMSYDDDDESVTSLELAKKVFESTILCPVCKELTHKDFGVWNSDLDAIICENCIPTLLEARALNSRFSLNW